MAKSLKGTCTERTPGTGFGKVKLADGRELGFDVDVVVKRDLPEVGESVTVVLGPSRLGGERVTKLTRVRAPRPTLDEALSANTQVPVGVLDERVALRHEVVGTVTFARGIVAGDLLGGDGLHVLAEDTDEEATVTAIFQGSELAFVRIDLAPFAPGLTWKTALKLGTDTASFCFASLAAAEALSTLDAVAELERAREDDLHGVTEHEAQGASVFLVPGESLVVRGGTVDGRLVTLVLDTLVCTVR